MPSAIDQLLSIFDLETIDDNYFRGLTPPSDRKRVFGGQVLAQGLIAAGRTVDDRLPHSLHAYFLRPGDPYLPILYTVDRVRDGKSFATRRVVARQHDEPIFIVSVSFHRDEDGLIHQLPMPDVPPPDSLPSEAELKDRFGPTPPERLHRFWRRRWPVEIRPVGLDNYIDRSEKMPHLEVWLRASGRLPDAPLIHRAMLAYACDLTLMDTALYSHGRSVFNRDLQVASLDHAMWFHRPFRADDWLLFANESPSSGGARTLARGLVYTQNGELVASLAQEGLLRVRPQPGDGPASAS